MKAALATLVLLALFASTSLSQQPLTNGVYAPYTQAEIESVTGESQPAMPAPLPPQQPHHRKHKKELKHYGPEEEELVKDAEDETYGDDLTEEEREERRRERKRYNKMFKMGMIVGTAVLAVIVFKFCKAKRIRNRNRMMNMNQQQQQVQMQQPYLYSIGQPVHPHAYPSAPVPHIQLARPYHEPAPVPVAAVRGRVHDSFIRQPVPVENPVEAQIRFHEAEIERLRQLRERSERREMREVEMGRVPINTTESFDSQHPMHRYRQVPIGQPIYPKDANSSFASEYPEI